VFVWYDKFNGECEDELSRWICVVF